MTTSLGISQFRLPSTHRKTSILFKLLLLRGESSEGREASCKSSPENARRDNERSSLPTECPKGRPPRRRPGDGDSRPLPSVEWPWRSNLWDEPQWDGGSYSLPRVSSRASRPPESASSSR